MAKIMIDPGHAPGNPNHGSTGYYEYAGMWKLSNMLKEALERNGYTVGLTRAENENPALTTRGERAIGCDLFIAEHSNAGGGKGCECYYSVRIPEDKGFAADFAAAVSGILGDPSRGAKIWHSTVDPNYDYLTVMGYAVYVGCPHVFLCENGFHDNAADEAQLKSDDKLREIAEAQARLICEYLSASYSGEPKAPETVRPSPSDTTELGLGDRVHVRAGVSAFADGTGMASFVRSALLYVRQLADGKVLISTQQTGAVTGWVRTADLVRDVGGAAPVQAPAQTPEPQPEPTPDPAPTAPAVGDKVRLKAGVTAFADGTSMASFIRNASVLYVRQLGSGKVLISTASSGAVTGWVKADDLVRT